MFLLVSKALLPTFLMTMSNRRGICRLAGLRDDVPAGRGQSGSVPCQRAYGSLIRACCGNAGSADS
jgi:hypothetical protein